MEKLAAQVLRKKKKEKGKENDEIQIQPDIFYRQAKTVTRRYYMPDDFAMRRR